MTDKSIFKLQLRINIYAIVVFVDVYNRFGLRQYRIIIVVQMCHEIFRQIDKSDAGILTYFKELLAKMTENIGTDAWQRRQPLIVRYCLNKI